MKFFRRKIILRVGVVSFLLLSWLLFWIGWGTWPNPEPEPLPWQPDAIIVLGGGNQERPREALRLSREYPDVPIVVTGDNGFMLDPLLAAGVSKARIRHEKSATSTVENAKFTDSILDELGSKRVVLVTNWFHVPRSLAVFECYQPDREFVASFETKPEKMNNWHRYATRRERLAALAYIVRYGIWSF